MSLTLRTGDYVHDYSWARPNLAEMKAQGCRAIVRYISTDRTGKNLTQAEVDTCARLGLGIILVWEQTATRMTVGGAAAGREDVAEAVRQARAWGYPAGCTIIFANDTDTNAGTLPNVYAYLDEVFKGIGEYRVGLYAEYEVIEAVAWAGYKVALWWQCTAWSGRYRKYITPDGANTWYEPENISTKAHVLQRVGHQLYEEKFGGATDENRWIIPFSGVWVPGQSTEPAPPSDTEDMLKFVMFPEKPGEVYMGAWYAPGALDTVRPVSLFRQTDPVYVYKPAFDALIPDEPVELRAPGWTNVRMLEQGAIQNVYIMQPGQGAGVPGPQGPKGDKGDKGDPGAPGLPGLPGASGVVNEEAVVAKTLAAVKPLIPTRADIVITANLK